MPEIVMKEECNERHPISKHNVVVFVDKPCSMKLQLRMLISLLPAAMAEFDNCDLANSEWVGFDQVITMPRRPPRTHMWDTWIERSW